MDGPAYQILKDDEIYALNRGGHDPFKVFQAYRAAKECSDKPTVNPFPRHPNTPKLYVCAFA
jgi:alpha-acetolactate decarboxylase